MLVVLGFGFYHWRRVVIPDWTTQTLGTVQAHRRRRVGVRRGRHRAHRLSPHAAASTNLMETLQQTDWPITLDDVRAARERISEYITPTAFREYPRLSELAGAGMRIFVKHENHQPTNSFKIRNGLSFMTALDAEQRQRGVVAASTGNHGQGIAYGARLLGSSATICVPAGNNPDKNAAMRALGATVVEEGRDYDEAVGVMRRIAEQEGRVMSHSTNDPRIVAGAGTMTLEIVEQAPDLDALVIAIGGGSQAVGALTVARTLAPQLEVFGVQAAGAPAIHDSWHAGKRLTTERADTFAEGVATRTTYDLTFDALASRDWAISSR